MATGTEPARELPSVQPLDGTVLVPIGARLFEGPGLWLQSAKMGYHRDNDWVERIWPLQVVGGEVDAIAAAVDQPIGAGGGSSAPALVAACANGAGLVGRIAAPRQQYQRNSH